MEEKSAPRLCTTDLSHVDADIAELERPCTTLKNDLFLLRSSSLDNASTELLDLRVVDGRLVNPFVDSAGSESCDAGVSPDVGADECESQRRSKQQVPEAAVDSGSFPFPEV